MTHVSSSTVNQATRMLTINEAAERVPGLSKWRIREMCISGKLPHMKAGRKYLINEQVLISYLTKGISTSTVEKADTTD